MAKVLGESGRYVSQEAVKKLHKIWLISVLVIAIAAGLAGIQLGLLISRRVPLWTSVTILVLMGILLLASKFASRKIDELERQRLDLRKGAAGENSVAIRLGDFPEEFKVINDLTTPFGNLDHVVVGPTGIFVLDTKSWRGVVASDCKGELLCNGKPTEKQHVRQFVGRIMGIKDKVKVLAPGSDPFFRPVFVFTCAKVDANWGTTGSVHCIRDDQLWNYIVESKFGEKLQMPDVNRFAQAFLALAHMDSEFASKPATKGQPNVA